MCAWQAGEIPYASQSETVTAKVLLINSLSFVFAQQMEHMLTTLASGPSL